MIQIRALQRADMEAYGELCRYAFSMTPETTSMYTDWVSRFIGRAWGAFEGGRLCAGLWYYPYEMRVGDRFIPMGGVAAVATAPEDRNAGLAKMLMTRAHRAMRAEGRPLAVLNPFKSVFYARMGYADTFFFLDCQMAPEQIAARDARAFCLREVDGEREWQTLERLHEECGARYFGTVRRDAPYWRVHYLAAREGMKRTYFVERGGQVLGFVITHLAKDGTLAKPTLTIVQAAWTETGVLDAILQFARSHRDQVQKIHWRLPIDVLLHDRMVDPQIEVALKPKMMLKLVDLKRAWELRTYPSDLDGEVVLAVDGDDTSPWNSGQWRARWRGGRVRAQRLQGRAQARGSVRVSVQTLALLYSGRASVQDLAADGRLVAPPVAQALLERAFPLGTPYIHEWF